MIDDVGVYPYKTNLFNFKRVYAVMNGDPVTFSSYNAPNYNIHYRLDAQGYGGDAWVPKNYRTPGEWIQVSSLTPKIWESVIIQGRGDHVCRITKFRIWYSIDGKAWTVYENGKQLSGAIDKNTKTIHNLKPFYATVVRLIIDEWFDHICMRFDAVFLENE